MGLFIFLTALAALVIYLVFFKKYKYVSPIVQTPDPSPNVEPEPVLEVICRTATVGYQGAVTYYNCFGEYVSESYVPGSNICIDWNKEFTGFTGPVGPECTA